MEVQPVNFEQMPSKQPGEPSSAIRERVIKARSIQSLRFKNHPGVHCNAQMTTALLHKYAEPDAEGMEKVREAIIKMNMSACYTLIIERIITQFINKNTITRETKTWRKQLNH